MEPYKIFGGEEECQSCESGWTMYIGDTADEEAQTEADDEGHGTHASETDEDNHGAETDDSMASDASSGPIQQGQGRFCSKHGEEEEDCSHCYSDKKAKKPAVVKQQKHDKEEKQEISLKTNESSTRSPSVRKNMWFRKTK